MGTRKPLENSETVKFNKSITERMLEGGGVLLCLEMSSCSLSLLDHFYEAHEYMCNLVVLYWNGSPFSALLIMVWGEGLPGDTGNP